MDNTLSIQTPKPFAAHMRSALLLGVPLVGSQLGGMLMNTTDTVMLGWYGIEELAAGAIATQLLFTVMMFGAGFAYAVVPMASESEGRGDVREVRRATRMGIWVVILFAAIAIVLLSFTERLFLALGQEPQIAALSGDYMVIAKWSVAPLLMWWTVRGFLTAIERTRVVFWATLAGVALNGLLNWIFIFGNWGAPEMGMAGAAIATLGTNSLIFGLLVAYCYMNERARPYEIFVRFWRADWPVFRDICRIGTPIGLMITAETGMFILASIFMGWFGVVALAAHGVTLQLASLAFMIPMGMSQAATSQVGAYLGQKRSIDLRRAAGTFLGLCLTFASFSATLFLIIPEPLIRLFLDDASADAPAVVAYAVPLLFVAACFQLTDTTQAIAAANLRGLKDTRLPMIIAVIAYWPVGLGLAYGLAFPLGMGGVGVWTGLATGLGVAAVLLNWRFWRIAPRG